MKKEIQQYIDYIEEILRSGSLPPDLAEKMLTRIQFYQHERLIHLIVTMTFAIMTVFSIFMLMTTGSEGALALAALFLALVIPYICHYYFLENSTQKLYKLYYKVLEADGKDKI